MGLALTYREVWLLLHIGLGVFFLHAFLESIFWLGRAERLSRLAFMTRAMSAMAWLTVITGTWMIYPWYRARPALEESLSAPLSDYPQMWLQADPSVARWQLFGMQWKEHVGWLTPILATAVAWTITYYGPQVAENRRLRVMLMGMLSVAFVCGLISGALGVIINKVAPNDFLDL